MILPETDAGHPKYRMPVEIDLSGPDGNAYSLICLGKRLAKTMGKDWAIVEAEMMEKDYDNLIAVFDRYFGDVVTLYK